MKFDQIAVYVQDIRDAKREYEQKLGIPLDSWKDDLVTARGKVGGVRAANIAELAFNYSLGYELELIRYVAGPNWHAAKHRVDANGEAPSGIPFPSHVGYHVENAAAEAQLYVQRGLRVIQEVETVTHTNPYLLERKRRYKYIVFDSRDVLGFDLKLIERIEPAPSMLDLGETK